MNIVKTRKRLYDSLSIFSNPSNFDWVITTKTKCASAVVCHLFSQRFNAKFKSATFDEESKIWTLVVEDDPWEYSTLADWKTWYDEYLKKKAEEEAAKGMEAAAEGAEMAMEGEMMAEEMAAEWTG